MRAVFIHMGVKCWIAALFALAGSSVTANTAVPSSIEELTQLRAVHALEQFIQATEQNLALQRALKVQLQHYLKAKEDFFVDSDRREYIDSLVKSAAATWCIIQQQQWEPMFPPDFIEELALFAQLAEKKQIASP